MNYMEALRHYWPIIPAFISALAVGVGTLINMLQGYPVIETWLHKAADILSVLPQEGTTGPGNLPVKLPFTRSKRPALAPPPVNHEGPGAGTIIVLILLSGVTGAMATCLTSCSAHQKKIASDMAACAIGSVPAAVAGVVDEVTQLLVSGSQDWESQLIAKETSVGWDAVVCSVKAALHDMQRTIPRHGQADPRVLAAIERGQIYLNHKGVK